LFVCLFFLSVCLSVCFFLSDLCLFVHLSFFLCLFVLQIIPQNISLLRTLYHRILNVVDCISPWGFWFSLISMDGRMKR
jgi:hypothetical protein